MSTSNFYQLADQLHDELVALFKRYPGIDPRTRHIVLRNRWLASRGNLDILHRAWGKAIDEVRYSDVAVLGGEKHADNS